jgi:hypothetical protein
MDEQTVRLLLRLTARISCAFFLLGFSARAATQFATNALGRRFAVWKCEAFLALAWSHTLHLVWIIVGLIITRGTLVHMPLLTGVFGGLGFASIYALAIVSSERALDSSAHRALERFAAYYVWSIFFLAMLAGAYVRHSAPYAVAAALLMITFVANIYPAPRRRPAETLVMPEVKARSQAS